MRSRTRRTGLGWTWLALLAASCARPTPKPISVAPTTLRDVPAVLRGTIGTEVTFQGIEPVVISGFGLVVGLNNTGGKPLPDHIQAHMERELALNGVSSALQAPGTALHHKTPKELLRDPRVAVVKVLAAAPPGAPKGARFDVFVEAVNASSLEGGLLYSTALHLGEPTVFGSAQTQIVGYARGPVFINPFADGDGAGVSETSGRILDGGWMTNPLGILMIPDVPSHARAASMVSAINSRIPEQPGDHAKVASGKATPGVNAGPGIVLRVPWRFRRRAWDFLDLVRHLSVDDSYPEQRARRYVEALKTDPDLAGDLAWCLEGIGERALPFVRELYDYGEPVPRLAALRAGARLGDPMAAAHLIEVASGGAGAPRLEAIELLAEINGSPKIDQCLTRLLGEHELTVRVAAYEALAKRAERVRLARLDEEASNPDSSLASVSPQHREVLARGYLPGGMVQGIRRKPVGEKFFLDVVPVGEPLIYVAQQGQPRIVVFGSDVRLKHPALVAAWQDRLLIDAGEGVPGVSVLYRPDPAARAATSALPGDTIQELVEYMAQRTTPEDPRPGLDLTYSQVVGALYAVTSAGATDAAFATERDRLKAGILEASTMQLRRDRPEKPGEAEAPVVFSRPAGEKPSEEPFKPKIVPLGPTGTGKEPSP